MAEMMVGQFVNFIAGSGYDGDDLGGEDDYKEIRAVQPKTEMDALVRCALAAGFAPNLCALYRNANKGTPSWVTNCPSFLPDEKNKGKTPMLQQEVSGFRGSTNADVANPARDGDWWMTFSDSMKMGRFNSIMDSSLIMSNTALLFANGVNFDPRKNEVYFDGWWAKTSPAEVDRMKECLRLRTDFSKNFAKCLEERDLSCFPKALSSRIAAFAMGEPILLDALEPAQYDVLEVVEEKHVNHYKWKIDEGLESSDEED